MIINPVTDHITALTKPDMKYLVSILSIQWSTNHNRICLLTNHNSQKGRILKDLILEPTVSGTERKKYLCFCVCVVDHVCGFEDIRICGFTQDRSDVFDWTRQNHLTQNPKRSVNTGPDMDRSGTKEGKNSYLLFLFTYY